MFLRSRQAKKNYSNADPSNISTYVVLKVSSKAYLRTHFSNKLTAAILD